MRISDWSSDVGSSDLYHVLDGPNNPLAPGAAASRYVPDQRCPVWASIRHVICDIVRTSRLSCRAARRYEKSKAPGFLRSAGGREGQEWVSTFRSRVCADH